MTVNKPWERQPGEPDDAFESFVHYRDMPKPRRIKRAANRTTAVISQWYNEYRWKERSLAYDDYLDSVAREEFEALLRQTAAERAAHDLEILADAKEIIQREYARLLDLCRSVEGGPTLIKPADLIKMTETVLKLERLIRGESTSNVQQTHDLSKLSLDELKKLEELESKISGATPLRVIQGGK